MEEKENLCCESAKNKKSKGVLSGVLFGLIPHSFCIAFALFSIIGAVAATTFLKKFLLIPHLFPFLIIISFLLATISSVIYLKRNECLCASGIKNKWKYISVLYCSTILVNLLMFFVVLPALANVNIQKTTNGNQMTQKVLGQSNSLSNLSINVDIPCSGHASLIIDEIKKNSDVQSVKFDLPSTFEIKYDPTKTTPEKIVALEIFKTYKATIIN